MPECEFKEYCGELCRFINEGHPYEECKMRDDILLYLNSPQFKKQYAKREDLEKAVVDAYYPYHNMVKKALELIRTHGLEKNRMSLIDLRSDEVISKEE